MSILTRAQLAHRLSTDPLYLHPEAASQVEHLLATVSDSELASMQEAALTPAAFDGAKPYRVTEAGLAVIPVHGYLAHRAPYHVPGRMTGYDYVTALAQAAAADPDVRGVVLDVNSHGGEVAGAFEAADEIGALAAEKPVWAIVDANAHSAAYLLSSAATRIVIPKAGSAGSIGVVTMHVDLSKLLDSFGVTVTLLYAGEFKVDGNPFEGLSEAARSRIEEKLEASYSLFVDAVARNRGIENSAVRNTKAGTFQGTQAEERGLIDAVMSPREAYAAFEIELLGSNTYGGSGMTTNTTKTEAGAEPSGDMVPKADLETARQEARQEATKAERERVSGILNCESSVGREALAKHLAFETDQTVEQAAALLEASPKAAAAAPKPGAAFESAMEGTPNPEVGAGDGSEPGEEATSPANDILAAYSRATGIGRPKSH